MRSVLIYSNCQGLYVRLLAANLSRFRADVNFKLMQYHLFDSYGGWDTYPDDFFDDVDTIWEQTGTDFPQHRERFHTLKPAHAQTVTFPALTMLSLWPLTGFDPRQQGEPLYPAGRYPWTDVVAAKISNSLQSDRYTDAELLSAYRTESVAALPDLDRRLAMDEARWNSRDVAVDVAMSGYLMDNFRRTQLFHTYGRPTAEPIRHILDQLIRRTELLSPGAPDAAGELTELAKRNVGYDLESCPIHPRVAAHFGLEWYDPKTIYRHHTNVLSYDQYLIRYMRNASFIR